MNWVRRVYCPDNCAAVCNLTSQDGPSPPRVVPNMMIMCWMIHVAIELFVVFQYQKD